MAKRVRKISVEKLEAAKEKSGWYLAAWRTHRGLTQQELADETGYAKSYISDLESGEERYNRDTHAAMAKALQVSLGFLMDVNPFSVDDGFTQMGDGFKRLATDLAKRA